VSGQLCAETYASALGDVYTFGPTFRAEDSNTARHLAEFWMIEPEMAFTDLAANMDNAEAYVKHVVQYALRSCADDFAMFAQFYDKGLKARLQALVETPFARVSYTEAVELLRAEIAKDPSKWEYPCVEFGTDLATEHERWLAEVAFGSAVFVYNYPKAPRRPLPRLCSRRRPRRALPRAAALAAAVALAAAAQAAALALAPAARDASPPPPSQAIKAFYMRDNDDGETGPEAEYVFLHSD